MGLGRGDHLFLYISLGLFFFVYFVCVCVEVVNGARKTGISCFCIFYWVCFLCLFCLCLC